MREPVGQPATRERKPLVAGEEDRYLVFDLERGGTSLREEAAYGSC